MSPSLWRVTGALFLELLCLAILTVTLAQDNELNATSSPSSEDQQDGRNETSTGGTGDQPEKSHSECLALPAVITEDVDTLQQIISIALNPDKKVRMQLEKKLGVEWQEETTKGPQKQGQGGETAVITEDEIKSLPKSGKMHALIQ